MTSRPIFCREMWFVNFNTAVKVGVPKLGNCLKMYTCAQACVQACTVDLEIFVVKIFSWFA